MGVGAVYTSTLAIQKLALPQNPPITQEDMLATALHPIVSFVVLNSIVVRASPLIILTSMCCNRQLPQTASLFPCIRLGVKSVCSPSPGRSHL